MFMLINFITNFCDQTRLLGFAIRLVKSVLKCPATEFVVVVFFFVGGGGGGGIQMYGGPQVQRENKKSRQNKFQIAAQQNKFAVK